MSRSHALFAFVCAGIFLVIWPLTLQKPGLPYSMKADEPSYYLIARSLWEDRDLKCEPKDLVRANDDFFYQIDNLILGTGDGWETAFFAKPYFSSMLAAPMVAAFGANGYLSFNMLLFLLTIWMSATFLSRENGLSLGLLFAGAYFFLSAAFQYVFWLQPEIAMMFFLTLAMFFTFHEFDPNGSRLARFASRWRWWIIGLAIGPVITTKPPYAVMFLPIVLAVLRVRPRRAIVALTLATMASTGAISLGQKALTGTWSPYLGALRRGYTVKNPNEMPTAAARREYLAAEVVAKGGASRLLTTADSQEAWNRRAQRGNDWSWIFALPQVPVSRIPLNFLTFLIGRHTGLFIFYPFAGIALLLMFSGGGARDLRRWAVVAGVVGVSSFLLLWNFANYHGGGGFVGNRYIAPIYGAGIFLVHRIRPRGLIAVGTLISGLFLGQVVFAPLGAPVDEPTLQAYTRATPFRWLPFEIQLGSLVPGQRGVAQSGAWITGRKDRLVVSNDWLLILGRGPAELWLKRSEPSSSAVFLLRTHVPGNVVELSFGDAKRTITFPDTQPPSEGLSAMVDLDVGPPDRQFPVLKHFAPESYWRVVVNPKHAARASWFSADDDGLVGVRLIYLGERDHLSRDVFQSEWQEVQAPPTVRRGERFAIKAKIINRSSVPWERNYPAQVRLGYHWKDAAGNDVPAPAIHNGIGADLAPGEGTEVNIQVTAPDTEGPLTLVLEPVYEFVRWFGEVRPESRRAVAIQIEPALPQPATTESASPQ